MSDKKAVLVIGDVMLDARIEGDMLRISPEAPAPVVKQSLTTAWPGGAANVAANLAALGRETYLMGLVGDDRHGHTLCEVLPKNYNVHCNICVAPDIATITKTRITCGGQQVMRVDNEADLAPAMSGYESNFKQAALDALRANSNIGAVVFADYAKGTISSALARSVVSQAAYIGALTLVDTKPQNSGHYPEVDVLKPNLAEALSMTRLQAPPLTNYELTARHAGLAAAQLVAGRFCRSSVVTCGKHGAFYSDRGAPPVGARVDAKAVYDVTGAGDTLMAALTDSLLEHGDLPRAVERACLAASVAVGKHGTTLVGADELCDAMMARSYDGKLLSVDDAAAYARRKQRQTLRVGLTNGCFRYLHHGHWDLLRWARAQCDKLIVAVNDDESIRELKGDKPMIPIAYRAEMLAACPFVDAVVTFSAPSAEETIRKLRPDVLIKGAEYESQHVPGADYVARNGGRVLFAPMTPDISTTRLLEQTGESGQATA